MPRPSPHGQTLSVERQTSVALLSLNRTVKRYRAQIRTLFGFREAIVADARKLSEWVYDQVAVAGCVQEQLAAILQKRCQELSIEPPAAERVDRIMRGAIRAHDERF